MPAVNDSIPAYDSIAANTQYESLLTDSLTAEQLIEMQTDSMVYSGKTATADEMYGTKSILLAKPTNPYTSGEGIAREYPLGSSWAFLPIIGVLLLALLLLRYTRGYLSQLSLLLISYKRAHKQYKSNLQSFNHTLLALMLFSVVPAAILISYVLNTFSNQLIVNIDVDYELYLIVGGFFLGFSVLKGFILSVAGILTYEEKLIQEMRYNSRIFLGAWGIVILPFVILLVVGDNEANKLILPYITLGLSILLYILYLIRTLQLFFSERVSIFFWILYLCTLELLPILLVFDYLFPFK